MFFFLKLRCFFFSSFKCYSELKNRCNHKSLNIPVFITSNKLHIATFRLRHATVQRWRPRASLLVLSFIAAATVASTPAAFQGLWFTTSNLHKTSSLRENKQQHGHVSNIIILSCWTPKKLSHTKDKKRPCEVRVPLATHQDWMWDLISERPKLFLHPAFGLSAPHHS